MVIPLSEPQLKGIALITHLFLNHACLIEMIKDNLFSKDKCQRNIFEDSFHLHAVFRERAREFVSQLRIER